VKRTPDFDELIGPDVGEAERARLHAVHKLLLQAGPPAELSPDVAGPTLAMTLQRRPRRAGHRVALLAAALALAAMAVLGG